MLTHTRPTFWDKQFETEIARAMSDLELANIVGIYTYVHLVETGIKNTPTTRFTYTSM